MPYDQYGYYDYCDRCGKERSKNPFTRRFVCQNPLCTAYNPIVKK